MVRKFLAAAAIAVMAGTAMGAAGDNYRFPSSTPPGDLDPQDVKQYVSFIWDDNSYSGEEGTVYEPKAGEVAWDEMGYVGGYAMDWNAGSYAYGANNPLNINLGDMGLSWAVETLGSKMNGGTMTFNMISGLFVPQYSTASSDHWKNYVSEYGAVTEGITLSEHNSIAVAWGREMQIGTGQGKDDIQPSFIVAGVNKMLQAGHEIGNHTIDHLETNSIWPEDKWPNGGDGFDNGDGKDMFGEPWDEEATFGGQNAYAYNRGWRNKAGYALETQTWEDILTLGEQDHSKNGVDIPSAQGSRLQGFRAPRLEVNSNMFQALANKGYLYDCGVEEGMEEDMDGTNFLWPYTVCNGVPNFTTKTEMGETIYATSFPQNGDGNGVWEVPVNLMVVPEGIRENVLEGANKLRVADGEEELDLAEWDGKITGFDFNMFILWCMTGDQVLETMKHTLDLHYNNNRAPMQVGGHVDYFTPMYDNFTLENDAAFKFALPKYNSGHGNTWEDRKATFEAFVDYAKGLSDVEFVSGYDLIQEIKAMQKPAPTSGKTLLEDSNWEFYGEGASSGVGGTGSFISGEVSFSAGYESYGAFLNSVEAGDLEGLSHISLNYNADCPLKVRLVVDGDNVAGESYSAPWEVTLNNMAQDVNSGVIPLSAFRYGKYGIGEKDSIETAKIIGIEIAPIAFGQEKTVSFSIGDFMLYGADNYGGSETEYVDTIVPVEDKPIDQTSLSSIKTAASNSLAIKGLTRSGLNLNVPAEGRYNVSVFSANGRVIKAFNNTALNAGVNNLKLNNLSSGMYMIKVQGIDSKTSLVKALPVM